MLWKILFGSDYLAMQFDFYHYYGFLGNANRVLEDE